MEINFFVSVLILAIVIVRLFFLYKVPKKTFMVLWYIVLCRMFLPFSICSRFSIYNITSYVSKTDVKYNNYTMIQNTDILDTTVLTHPAENNFSPVFVLWLIGFIICVLSFIVIHIRCKRQYNMSLPIENEFISKWQQVYSIKRKIQIRHSDKINTALTYGIFKPVILLPKSIDYNNIQRLEYILTHEFVHIKHFDIFTKWLLATSLCIYWFNPFVWLMYVISNRDIELVCDETVVKLFGEVMKSDYAITLIDMEEDRSKFNMCSNFSKNLMEERIKAIMKIKKITILSLTVTITLVLGITIVFATSKSNSNNEAQYIAESSNSIEQEELLNKYGTLYNTEGKNLLEEYSAFGISFDTEGKMYYNGELIHYFWDGSLIEGGLGTHYKYLNEEGTINLHTIRKPIKNKIGGGVNPFGYLTEVAEFTYFDNPYNFIYNNILKGRTVSEYYNSEAEDKPIKSNQTIINSAENSNVSGIFTQYNEYGLVYDEAKKRLYYKGKLVRHFEDILQTGFSSYDRFLSATREDGEVDVHTVFDDNGQLIGIEIFNPDEFHKETNQIKIPEVYSEYEKYDLVHSDDGRFYYKGKLVRHFEDILKSDSNTYIRHLSSTNTDGEIDVHTVFDASGELIGIKPFSEDDFIEK